MCPVDLGSVGTVVQLEFDSDWHLETRSRLSIRCRLVVVVGLPRITPGLHPLTTGKFTPVAEGPPLGT